MKVLWAILISIAILGCSEPVSEGRFTGIITTDISTLEMCKAGVVYYTRGQGIAPAYRPDGSLFTCQE